MSWAQRRKTTYSIFFVIALFVLAVIIVAIFPQKQPTCFDGIQNQGETGIDCGGPCTILCHADYASPTVLWTQWAKVESSGTYNLVAYAENPNLGVGAIDVPYSFKIYDANNILLYSATGTADIPASNNFVVFESGINVNDKVPARVDFEFSPGYTWQKVADLEQGLSAVSQPPIDTDTAPKLFATLTNNDLTEVDNIQSVAILYDTNGNAIAFSKTFTDSIAPGATADIAFTWPEPFTAPVYKTEIVSQVLPH